MSNRSAHGGIVVAVDGSAFSTMAVRWAAREAGMRNVPLSIIHIIDMPPSGLLALGGAALPEPTEAGDWQKTEGANIISAAIKVAEDSAESGVHLKLFSEVYFAATLPALIDLSKEAQMIVVGSRGQGMARRVLLGSVSSRLIHHAHCPVAVIHDEAPLGVLGPSKLPVLVGIDGSPASESATAIAFDAASRRGVDLIALHAWRDKSMSVTPDIQWSGQRAAGEEALAERLAGLRERYPDVVVHLRVVLDRPAEHLLDDAASSQLVVVGSHGRGGFAGMLLGSVSTAVAEAAHVPVIVARQH
jgi:nucleotide-binding universal stress UspA family protein